jgi:hypothetical protein
MVVLKTPLQQHWQAAAAGGRSRYSEAHAIAGRVLLKMTRREFLLVPLQSSTTTQ